MSNVVNLKAYKDDKEIIKQSKIFKTTDATKYASQIETTINSICELGSENDELTKACSNAQLEILSKIMLSYFKILFDQIDNISTENSDIIYSFLSDLDEICCDLPNIEIIKEKKAQVLKFINKEKNTN